MKKIIYILIFVFFIIFSFIIGLWVKFHYNTNSNPNKIDAENISQNFSNQISSSKNLLYPIHNQNNELLFINEKGEIIVKFNKKEFDYSGAFKEGKVFLVKEIKNIGQDGMYDKILSKLAIMDYSGKIIKVLPFYGIIYAYGNDDPIPEYRNGKACIELENGKSIFIDSNGEYISDSKIPFYEYFVDINLNEWYSKGKILDVYPSKIYPIDKDGPFPDFIEKGINGCECDFGCINYRNKTGEIAINSNFCKPGGSGDFTRDPYFYNGIATVFENENIPKRKFIDKKGNYINDDIYEFSTPFWRKLAFVINDKYYGYINTDGEWVFKLNTIKKENK